MRAWWWFACMVGLSGCAVEVQESDEEVGSQVTELETAPRLGALPAPTAVVTPAPRLGGGFRVTAGPTPDPWVPPERSPEEGTPEGTPAAEAARSAVTRQP